MTTYNKNTLKTFFQTNDVPDGNDYANLIDSQINIVETASQSMAGPLVTTELVTPRVSATAGIFSSVSAASINAAVLNTSQGIASLGQTIIAGSVTITSAVTMVNAGISIVGNGDFSTSGGSVLCSALNVAGGALVSRNTGGLFIGGDVSANSASVYCSALHISSVGIVSAAGTTQGAAAVLTNSINRLQGINDGAQTGFAIPANKVGLVQYIVNETATSANLWPPTGGTINNLGVNNVFALAGGTSYTIFHTRASAYGVK
jgi:hypothetical protein